MNPVRFFVIALLLACSAGAAAQGEEGIDAGILDEAAGRSLEGASGFIVDRTITNIGGQFTRLFSEAWRELDTGEGIDLSIIERPSARHGSLVWVEHNGRPIVRIFLYAGRGATLRPAAVAAAQHVAKQVADESLARALLHDPDLARDGY